MHGALDGYQLLECSMCGGWYTTRPGAREAHHKAIGHWPRPTVPSQRPAPSPDRKEPPTS